MLVHPQFDPIALTLGPVQIHWYGLTYLAAFALFLRLATWRTEQLPFIKRDWKAIDIQDLLFFGVLGVIVGGRLGYVLFYKPADYLSNPTEIVAVWKGGMAFHGGLLGVLVAMVAYARSRRRKVLEVTDLIAPCVPVGLGFGRIGNFINGELWGRAADSSLPWAMVFPQSGDALPRHPSQLYQFALEGFALFVLTWFYARRPESYLDQAGRPTWGKVSATFLIGYGFFRFAGEWFREPDDFLGLLAFNMSMGQWLSLPMMVCGAVLWAWAHLRKPGPGEAWPDQARARL